YDLDANEATRDLLVSVRVDDVRGPSFLERLSFGYHRSHDLFVDATGEGPFDVSAWLRDVNGAVPRVYFEGLASPSAPVPPGLRLVTQSVYLWPSDPYLSLSSRKNFEYQGTYTRSAGTAVFGYTYERQNAEITGRSVDRDNHAGFVHLQQTVAGRLFLSAGARIERNSAFGAKWTPRGAASYRLGGQHGALSATYLRASAGIGITDPSLLQNFARDPYFVGNPALKPERATSYDAGVVQEWFGRRLRTDASAFDSTFKDLIAFVFLPFPQPATWQNIQASRARGLEFSAQGRITALVSVAGAYTRMWTRVTRSNSPNTLYASVGQELPRRPGNSAALSLSLTPRRWMLHAGATLVGERQDTNLFGVTRNPGYQNVWVSGSLRLTKGLAPFVRAENLLNRYYEEVLGYPAARRSIHGGLRFEW
ncbi:MAG: TonB-dependent receptor, partial [Bryobacteraceae bacterium]